MIPEYDVENQLLDVKQYATIRNLVKDIFPERITIAKKNQKYKYF